MRGVVKFFVSGVAVNGDIFSVDDRARDDVAGAQSFVPGGRVAHAGGNDELSADIGKGHAVIHAVARVRIYEFDIFFRGVIKGIFVQIFLHELFGGEAVGVGHGDGQIIIFFDELGDPFRRRLPHASAQERAAKGDEQKSGGYEYPAL